MIKAEIYKVKRDILYWTLFFMPVTIYGFLEFNGLLLTPFYLIMPFTILHFIKRKCCVYKFQKKIVLYSVVALLLSIINIASWSSAFHFLFYVVCATIIISLLKADVDTLVKLCKQIIMFLFIITAFSVLFYNIGICNPTIDMFFPHAEDGSGIRFSSLTSEPSYYAIFTTVCMVSMLFLKEKEHINNIRFYFIIYFIGIVLSRTSYGMLLFGISLIYALSKGLFFGRKINSFRAYILPSIFVILIVIIFKDNYFVSRIFNVFSVFSVAKSVDDLSFLINNSDGSAGMRFLPTIMLFTEGDYLDYHFWIGHGIGQDATFFPRLLWQDNASDYKLMLGYIPASLYNFGVLGGFILLYYIIKPVLKLPLVFIVIGCLSLVNCNVSTQLFWFIIIMYIWVILCYYGITLETLNKEIIYGSNFD